MNTTDQREKIQQAKEFPKETKESQTNSVLWQSKTIIGNLVQDIRI